MRTKTDSTFEGKKMLLQQQLLTTPLLWNGIDTPKKFNHTPIILYFDAKIKNKGGIMGMWFNIFWITTSTASLAAVECSLF